MPTTRFLALALLVLILMLLPPWATAQQGSGSKVAVANLVKVFGQLQKTKDLQSQMMVKTETLKQQRLMKENEIRDLTANRDLLNPSAAEYSVLQEKIVEKTIELQAWLSIRKHQIEREQKVKTLAVFGEITAAVAKVAESRGIEIVLAEQKPEVPEDLEQVTVLQLQSALAQRNVLYTRAVADISDAVILQLDADYKAGR